MFSDTYLPVTLLKSRQVLLLFGGIFTSFIRWVWNTHVRKRKMIVRSPGENSILYAFVRVSSVLLWIFPCDCFGMICVRVCVLYGYVFECVNRMRISYVLKCTSYQSFSCVSVRPASVFLLSLTLTCEKAFPTAWAPVINPGSATVARPGFIRSLYYLSRGIIIF